MEVIATSIKDAAKALSLGRTSIYALVKEGRLDTVKLGRRTLWLRLIQSAACLPRFRPMARLNPRKVKTHRSYTIDEVARTLGVAKGTVRRWLKAGLRALTDQRPFLVLGHDLANFLAAKPSRKHKCRLDECYCFSCRAPRRPAFGAVEYLPVNATGGNLRALCEQCATIMHKRITAANYEALKVILAGAVMQVSEHISACTHPSVHEHFGGEIKTHA